MVGRLKMEKIRNNQELPPTPEYERKRSDEGLHITVIAFLAFVVIFGTHDDWR